MLSRRRVMAAALLASAFRGADAASPLPVGYPRSYRDIVAAAVKEKRVVVYANADLDGAADLIGEFMAAYPGVTVVYRNLDATDLYDRFVNESAKGEISADLVWSSAMDRQAKLINDGYAQAYGSPEKPNLPDWAVWRNEGWGTTAEPIVFAYNRDLLPAGDVPQTHDAFEHLLRTRPEAYHGKVATYDPTLSGVGFLFLAQDVSVSRDTWKLIRALGHVAPGLYTSTSAMIDKLDTGEHLIAYNAIGSYVLERMKGNPSLGIVFPSDYTHVMSRIAFIARDARHPNAARLFLDYLLSQRGQALLGRRSLSPVRNDMLHTDVPTPRPEQVQAIRVGQGLLANLDQLKRNRFLREWRSALGLKP
jgi:iron(III) transport system substrate-binding protein